MGKMRQAILDELSPRQQEAAGTIDRDVLVRAGAGSGKTKTLVAHYLLLLDEHRTWHPADITAVTFTRKAAREMQSRIRKEMMRLVRLAGIDIDEKRFWLECLNGMDSANIGTIHSLCGRILRVHPAEAGLDPAFSVLDDNNAALQTARIVEEFISNISADRDYEALLNFYDGSTLTKILTEMLKNREKTDAAMAVPGVKTEVYLRNRARTFLTDPDLKEAIGEYREISSDPAFGKKYKAFQDRLQGLIRGYDEACGALEKDSHPADVINLFYDSLSDWTLKKRSDGYNVNLQKIKNDLRDSFPFLVPDTKKPNQDIAWYKKFWEQYDEAEGCLRNLWPDLRDGYMKFLDNMQAVDFDSMESLTLKLLRTCPEIREVWGDRVKALLVDEFQDTNDVQSELFTLLDPGHDRLFAVGDKKQSIYGFRGTNVALFDRRGKEVANNYGRDIHLDTTYRTDPELLGPMGNLLQRLMADEELFRKDYYAAYEAMQAPEDLREKRDPLPKEPPYVEVLLADPQQKEGDPEGEIVGRMLAQRLAELMDSGLLHSWNDAAILCRNSKDFKQFEKALEAWHIPYVTVAGKGYYDRSEIRDILNTLRAAENPDDNAALTGFLLSPSVGFTLEMTALLYRHANSGGLKKSFYQALTDADFNFEDEEKQKKLDRARSILKELIRVSGQVPLDEVLEKAISLTGIRTMLALDSGDRAWLNLDKLLPTARESGLTSVSEFLEYLENISETGAREGEAPSDSSGAVRIMTIHQAKGLEFRVTIIHEGKSSHRLPSYVTGEDGAPVFYSSPASPRYTDVRKLMDGRDKAEWLRLFYVAATRAEYRLILCGKKPSPKGNMDTWLKRVITEFPDEWLEAGEHTGSAWGIEGQAVRVRCCSALPVVPDAPMGLPDSEVSVRDDYSLLAPISAGRESERGSEHTAALTVGRLVHKGLEMWHFPGENRNGPELGEAFRKILMQTDNLDPAEQQAVREKAEMLLSRFRDSDARLFVESFGKCWHEIPFSFTKGIYTVNGVVDLLLKDETGYAIIDFKTDELKNEKDLTGALEEHRAQLEKYRRALNTALGEDPRWYICFLDYCGRVKLIPGGKAAVLPVEDDGSDEWLPDEPEPDEFWFEDEVLPLDPFPPDL